jgi:hypothetical protein
MELIDLRAGQAGTLAPRLSPSTSSRAAWGKSARCPQSAVGSDIAVWVRSVRLSLLLDGA